MLQEANARLNLPTTRILAPERAALLEGTSSTITASRKLAQEATANDTADAGAPTSVAFGPETQFDPIRFQPQYQFEDADPDFAEQLRVSNCQPAPALYMPHIACTSKFSTCAYAHVRLWTTEHRNSATGTGFEASML